MGIFRSLNKRTPQNQDQIHRHLVLGWDRAALEAVRLLLGLGSEVIVVAADRPDGLPTGTRAVEGRPGDPEVLRRAGIGEAESVLVALPTQEACRALAAAKRLNPRARLVASVQEAGSDAALREAGASLVIDARKEAGREMVRLMLPGTPKPGRRGERLVRAGARIE